MCVFECVSVYRNDLKQDRQELGRHNIKSRPKKLRLSFNFNNSNYGNISFYKFLIDNV